MRKMRDKEIAGNSATGWIKLLALFFMCADHAGKMLFGNMIEMRVLGRIAFPLYCWCMVVGICHTRSAPKYILRIALVGIISQPLNMLALNHTWTEPCVFLTLTLGLIALWGIRERRWGSELWMPALALAAAALTGTDYGWRGVLLIILLYMARTNRPAIAAVMIAMSLFWGTTSASLGHLFGQDLTQLNRLPGIGSILPSILRLQAMMLLSLPLMLLRIPRSHDLRMPRWLGYSIYPLHLVVLYAVELVTGCVRVMPIDLIRPILALFGQ